MLPFKMIPSELAVFSGQFTVFIPLTLLVTATLYLKSLWSIKKPGVKLTWRIREIPVNVTKEDLQSQLEHAVQGFSRDNYRNVVEISSLAPSSSKYQCATVICEEEVAHALKDRWVIDKSFIGVTPLFDPGNAEVDVIAVSGLASHALGSFKSKNGNEVWLRDFLPTDVKNTRVLIYGYDTALAGGTWNHSIVDLAKFLLESIKVFRQDTETTQRPIVFIGHSLGGLLIKEALSLAIRRHSGPDNHKFFRSCYGLLFFGVPNLGLRNEQLRTMVAGRSNSQLVNDLLVKKDSEATPFLNELKQKFFETYEIQKPSFEIISCYERRESPTVELQSDGTWKRTGDPCLMVTQDSACCIGLGDNFHQEIPLDTDHSGLVKFDSRADDIYRVVKMRIQKLVDRAPAVVNDRFCIIEGGSEVCI